MRFCLTFGGPHLEGAWNRGPQGGPMLGGTGTGVRIFAVTGTPLVRQRSEALSLTQVIDTQMAKVRIPWLLRPVVVSVLTC
jgi:hypothetical protein